ADLTHPASAARLVKDSSKFKIHYEYFTVFNGFSVTVSDDKFLRGLRSVEKIYPVEEFSIPEPAKKGMERKADSVPREEFLPPLNIPEVWQKYHLDGTNIKIAIFDTGIDYTHPDLGGCLGPNCKVMGGYDFVNNDKDPMDDASIGHGTHVAGIAAGEGIKKGAAPKARLLAYKVLNYQGAGSFDAIIRAIEYSLDPNQDGNFEDAPQVMNFSLGGQGGIDHPICLALDRAANFSVVVAAAGNYGASRWGGSSAWVIAPAAAIQSVAVAATDGTSTVASFSSGGPSESFTAKPDIAAPGVNIWSTMPQGKYAQMSGTSMASPLAAGIVALIVQKLGTVNSNTSDIIKGLISTTASPIPCWKQDCGNTLLDNFFHGGAGLIQPALALDDGFALVRDRSAEKGTDPSSTPDLGVIPLASSIVDRSFKIPFQYYGKSPRQYEIVVEHDLGKDASVTFEPKELVVTGSGSEKPFVNLTVRQTVSNLIWNPIFPYSRGVLLKIREKTSGVTLNVPVAGFLRAHYKLIVPGSLSFDQPFGGGGLYPKYPPDSHHALVPVNNTLKTSRSYEWNVYLKPGIYYDFYAGFSGDLSRLNFFGGSGVNIEKSFVRDLDLDDVPNLKVLTLKQPDGKLARNTPIRVDMKPKFPSLLRNVGYHLLHTNTDGEFKLYTNEIDNLWESSISSFWMDGINAMFLSERISNIGQSEKVELPSSGYATFTINPQIPTIVKPAYYCHSVTWRPYTILWNDTVIPSQANVMSVGKTKFQGLYTWDSWMVVRPPQGLQNPCVAPDWFVLNMASLTNGLPALVGNDGNALIEMPSVIEVGNTTPIPAGRATVTHGQKISFENLYVTYGGGETASRAVNYKIATAADKKVISEGAIQWLQDVNLQPGQYVLHRWLSDAPDKALAETQFTVRNEAGATLLPSLKHFLWKQTGNEMDIILSAGIAPAGYVESDVSMMGFRVRKSPETDWADIHLVAVEGKRSVWKGKLILDGELEKYEAMISFSNQAGDRQNIYLKKPFSKNNKKQDL
ncbi:MAG: S8 family serine peptidase, partial [Deltaproteobacteria bacterium]|nr:S8 family serine peptidase [Deltaproteobacteria bacterium]